MLTTPYRYAAPCAILRGLLAVLLLISGTVHGADSTRNLWNGHWTADAFPIVVRTRASEGALVIEPVRPDGQQWRVTDGRIAQRSATVQAQYRDVIATIRIRLRDENTAIVSAESCEPEFHVICTLARNQQAVFRRADPGSVAD